MSQLYSNCPPYWNSNDQRFPETPSKGLTLKVDYPSQHDFTGKSLNFNLQDQDSPSSQSTQSNHDLTAIAVNNSHDDQCMSSDCGQEDSFHKNVGGANPVYVMGGHPETGLNTSQTDYSHTMAYMPYPCADRYFNGLLTTYAPGPVVQPDVMGVTTPRVPLPLDITEDEPIYVNAKQYHGILRRRQLRAKLEAQNKLVKNRKPYLHESRHLHALNRVRGSGGRFLSTKKSQQSNSTAIEGAHAHAAKALVSDTGVKESATGTGTLNFLNGDVFFQQADRGFLSMSSTHTGGAMQQNGTFMKDSTNQHFSPMVQ